MDASVLEVIEALIARASQPRPTYSVVLGEDGMYRFITEENA